MRRERPPLVPVGSAPEPWLNRAVAFRSHQVRPAALGAGTITTVTLGPQPKEAIGSENLSPVVHSREQDRFRTTFPVLQSPRRDAIRSPRGAFSPGPCRSQRRA